MLWGEVWKSAESHPWPQGANQMKLSPWRSWLWHHCSQTWKLKFRSDERENLPPSPGDPALFPTRLVLACYRGSWDTWMPRSSNQKHVVGFSFPQFTLWKWQTFLTVFKIGKLGTSLTIQWFRLHASNERQRVWSLVAELRCHVLYRSVTKKVKVKKRI